MYKTAIAEQLGEIQVVASAAPLDPAYPRSREEDLTWESISFFLAFVNTSNHEK